MRTAEGAQHNRGEHREERPDLGGVEAARLRWLAGRAAALLRRLGLDAIRRTGTLRLEVCHDAWAGAYGRPHPEAERLAAALAGAAGTLDATYAAKACYAALRRPAGDSPVLFWQTFDGRWLSDPLPDHPMPAGGDPG